MTFAVKINIHSYTHREIQEKTVNCLSQLCRRMGVGVEKKSKKALFLLEYNNNRITDPEHDYMITTTGTQIGTPKFDSLIESAFLICAIYKGNNSLVWAGHPPLIVVCV